MGELINQKFS